MTQRKYIDDRSQTLGTSSSVISQAVFNGQRVAIVIRNTSLAGEIINLSQGSEAATGRGIQLNQGDTWTDTKDAGYTPSSQQITGIASAVTATISIHEVIERMD